MVQETRLAEAGIENPFFSIIIPTWNNLAYLRKCIHSIRKHSRHHHEIIVHVNQGQDGTLEWLRTQKDISYNFSVNNIGICYALNLARELVRSDYLVYMNDDMYVAPDWDVPLWNEISIRDGDPMFFYSATQMQPGSFWDDSILDESNYGTNVTSFREDAFVNECHEQDMADWNGATWPPNIVHKSIWDAVGGYSTEFSPGLYSDPDFSMKLWKFGVRDFRGIGKSRVYHFESKSTRRNTMNKGSIQFLMKWGLTAGTFSKYYLRRGQPYHGPLSAPKNTWELRIKKILCKLKRSYYALTSAPKTKSS